MRLRLRVHLEAVLVAHLPGADLAVPAQALQAFGFELVVEVLGRADFGARHVGRAFLCLEGREGGGSRENRG